MLSLAKSRLSGKTLFFIFIFLILSTFLTATIINVPADQPTIQEGIDAAVDADTVLVQPGTYVENINYNGKLIVIGSLFLTTQNTTYISQTIIDGNNIDSVVIFEGGEDSTAVLTGFTIRNGNGSSQPYKGGGIFCVEYSSPILSNLVITNNAAQYGGGIYCKSNSNPKIINVTASNNSSYLGGGIYCRSDSNPYIFNVTLDDNYGGGLGCDWNCNPVIQDAIITNNYNGYGGGGVECYESSPNLTNVTITGNTAGTYGGGIFCDEYSSPILTNLTISYNSADLGGGIYCENDSEPTIINALIINNSADYGGGICCCTSSSLNLVNNTISDNSATLGGGIYSSTSSYPVVTNSILWDNYPEEIHLGSGYCSVLATYSNIEGGWEGTGNIDEDPLFVGYGSFPFSLLDDSPCVNTAIPDTTGLNLPEYDLAGNPRIFGGRIEMGAYENQNVVVSTDENSTPLVTNLNQNYPNPFNPLTTISFDINENETGILTIFNIKGQLIESHRFESGEHNYLWDASDQSSGIYFYELKTKSITETKKMLLLK